MSANLYKAPTSNFWSSSLNGAINDSVDTITLNSVSGLQSPGYIVIDRENGSGTATPSSREVVKYTGISGSDLTGCTRGADNSTARSHSDGALVEAVFTIGMHNDQRDSIAAEHTVAGVHSILSAPTITQGWINAALLANATITTLNNPNAILGTTTVSTLTMVGGASVAPTVEGQINWRTGDDTLMVGDGAASAVVNMGTWLPYTPTVTNFLVGNGNVTGSYSQIGKTVNVRARVVMGSTPSISGVIGISLPVTAKSSADESWQIRALDNGTNSYVVNAYKAETTRVDIYANNSAGNYQSWSSSNATIPFTWAVNDAIYLNATYEAA